jgi:hypothetical protein
MLFIRELGKGEFYDVTEAIMKRLKEICCCILYKFCVKLKKKRNFTKKICYEENISVFACIIFCDEYVFAGHAWREKNQDDGYYYHFN